jgi:hypothetical protein
VWANDFVREATMLENRPALMWQRSTRCSNAGCVEVATAASESAEEQQQYLVRDSKDPQSPELTFDRAAWRTFIEGVKNGDLDGR